MHQNNELNLTNADAVRELAHCQSACLSLSLSVGLSVLKNASSRSAKAFRDFKLSEYSPFCFALVHCIQTASHVPSITKTTSEFKMGGANKPNSWK